MELALPLPMLPLLDDALLPGEPLAWLPLVDEPRLDDEPLAWLPLDEAPLFPDSPPVGLALDDALLPLDRESLLALPLCALSLFDEPMLPEPLEPILPPPDTLGEPLPDCEPLVPFCVESLPMLLPVPSFDF